MNFPYLTEKEQHNLTFDIIENPKLFDELKYVVKKIKKIDSLNIDEKIELIETIKSVKLKLKNLSIKDKNNKYEVTKLIYGCLLILLIIIFLILHKTDIL
jgi:hypothetical protein